MTISSVIRDPAVDSIRGSLRGLLDHEAFASVPPSDYEAAQRRTYAQLRVINEWAGSGSRLLADPLRYFTMLEFAGLVNPSLLHVAQVHYGVCLYSALSLGGGSAQSDDVVASLDRMDAVGGILMTELGYANSHMAIGTCADYDSDLDEFVLSTPAPACKKFMPHVGLPGVAKIGLVTARLRVRGRDHGVFQFLVPLRDKNGLRSGITIALIPGSSSIPMDLSIVSFKDMRVPRASWLNDTATLSDDGTFMDPLGDPDRRLIRSCVAFANSACAAIVGAAAMARACVYISLCYASRRVVKGRLGRDQSVLQFRAHRKTLFGAFALAYGATCLANRAVAHRVAVLTSDSVSSSNIDFAWAPWADVSRFLGIIKCITIDMAEQVAVLCRRVSGAQGALHINRIPVYEDFISAYHSAGGDNNLISFDAGRDMALGIGYSPPEIPAPPKLDLCDPDTLRYLAAQNERAHYEYLATALAAGRAEQRNGLALWDPNLEVAADLARAYGYRLVVESLLDAAFACERDGDLIIALTTLLAIDRMRTTLLDKPAAQALEHALSVLSPNYEKLIQAFDLSRELADTPIASEDYIKAFD